MRRFSYGSLVFLLASLAALAGCGERRSKEDLKGTLIYGYGENFKTFDPARQIFAQESAIMIQVLEPLVVWNNDLELEPRLATSWEQRENCRVWVFHLRRDVTFHDGTPFTSEAVKIHFERIMNPDTAATRRNRIQHLSHIEIPDDYTVEFHLKQPDCVLPEVLTGAFASIPSPNAMARWGDDFGRNPVGTGPFVFEKWVPDVVIQLRRNPDYWGRDQIHIERLLFKPVRENTTRLILLEQGMLDMADISYIHVNIAKKNPDILLQSVPSLSIRYIGFNTQKPPFSDKRVRQAANYAINKEDMVKYMFFGVGSPAKSVLPPALHAHNPDVHSYAYNPEKAKQLLNEAGYPNGVDCVMWTTETGLYRNVADATVEYLRKVGIRVEMKIFDGAAYWDQFDEYQTPDGKWFPQKEGVFDMFAGGWTGGETAHGFLEPLFRTLSSSNSTFYTNPQVDQLLNDFKYIPDEEGRNKIYRQLQEIIVEDAPWIFASHGQANTGIRHRVHNFRINPSGMYFFQGVTLDDPPGQGDPP